MPTALAPPPTGTQPVHDGPATTTQSASPLSLLEAHKNGSSLDISSDDSLQKRIEKLGRQRPPDFATGWSESLFVFSITMSQFLVEYFVSGFTVILPVLIKDLDIPQASSVWPATAFSLVIAATLLIFGRLGDMRGAPPVFFGGLVWLLVWSIVAGFSVNPIMLVLARALQGLGAAAYLPTGIALMGSIYRPGPRKNLVFALYGTSAVMGFFGGIFVAGMVGQYLRWGFYFWIGAILAAVTLVASIFSNPRSASDGSPATKMDYLGAVTIAVGLTLIVTAITQSAHSAQGWRTPYIPTCMAIGVVSLLSAIYIETRVSPDPLLPAEIFTGSAMKSLLLGLFLLYGTWGIFSVYGTLYFQNIMGASPLKVVAWYVPLGVTGLLISVLEGYVLHLVPGRALLIISGLGAVISQLLLALMPPDANYWAWIFPATIASTIGIDLSTILMTVYVSTTLPKAQQGLAGSLINSVLQLGVAFSLGLTDVVQSATVEKEGLERSYKYTFWFGVGAGAAGLIVMGIWGVVPKATSELTVEEKEELVREAAGLAERRA